MYTYSYPDVLKTAEFICQEIRKNVESDDVLSIMTLNQIFDTSFKEVVPEDISTAIKNSISSTSRKMIFVSISASSKALAYKKWYNLVSKNSDWDHKPVIQEIQNGGTWACDHASMLKFYYDIWSNIHYGFIGRYAGFTEFELTSGAGVAQFMDNNMTIKEWVQQYSSNFRDGGIIGAFDDPCDTNAVKVGYSLYNKFKVNPSGLTAEHILKELYSFYNQGKKLNIEGCGFQCRGCGHVLLAFLK